MVKTQMKCDGDSKLSELYNFAMVLFRLGFIYGITRRHTTGFYTGDATTITFYDNEEEWNAR